MTNCDCPIQRLDIVPYIDGGTRISWQLRQDIELDPASTFEVQVSRYATDDPSVWTAVGTGDINTAFIVDDQKRTWGSTERIYYRVHLLPNNCYSWTMPSRAGVYDCREPASVVREIIRRERLRHTLGEASLGTLLKRRFSGVRCTECTDPDYAGRGTQSFCLTCYQTGWTGGYYLNPRFYADLSESGTELKRGEYLDVEGADQATTLRYLNIPDVQPGDVWVEYDSDHRWIVDKVKALSKAGSYVLVAAAEVRRLGFEDVVYKYEVPRY